METSYIFAILTGVFAGICSGLFGVGGGIIIVPLTIYFFKVSQQSASATSLVTMLIPIGVAVSAWNYYKAGYLQNSNLRLGLFIAGGMILGAFLGSKIAVQISSDNLRKIFAIFLVLVALRLWMQK